jgi:hypothetical protein
MVSKLQERQRMEPFNLDVTMMRTFVRIGALGALAAGLAALPLPLPAQTNLVQTNAADASLAQTNAKPAVATKAAGAKKAAAAKKSGVLGFHGKLAAVDQVAKTITVGTRTFQITSETRIFKDGKPAILEEGVIDEPVSGGYKKVDQNKLVATKVSFGAPARAQSKAAAKKSESKKAETPP